MDKANMMMKIAELAPESFEQFNRTWKDVENNPFKEEIVSNISRILEKKASLGRVIGGVGAGIAVGIANSLAGDLYDAARRGITKGRDYKAMLQANPDLKDLPADHVQKIFSTLHRFNPDFAGDPTVAGSFVRQQAGLSNFDTQLLGNTINARKNLNDVKELRTADRIPMWDADLKTDRDKVDIAGNLSRMQSDSVDASGNKGKAPKGKKDFREYWPPAKK